MNDQLHNGITGRTASDIAASVEAAARGGRLRPGDRLPPIRDLAAGLGVSPNTTAAAIGILRLRGVVVTRGRRGTFLASRPPLPVLANDEVPPGVRDLARGNPDPALLPRRLPALGRNLRWPGLYGQPADDPGLLASFASELEADGLDASRTTFVSGAMDGVERVLAARLRPGDAVAVEDPGHPGVHDLVAAMGFGLTPVTLDDGGPTPGSLRQALDRGVAAVVVTPRGQNPTGAALDDQRVAELTGVLAGHPDVLVVEDDHAAQIAGSPARTLTGGRSRWAVIRSVSKTLGPDLRLAALAGDETTVGRVAGRRIVGMGWVSHILQRLTLALRQDPETGRLLAAAERAYRERRQALLDALAACGIHAVGRTGLSVWLSVPRELPVIQGLRDTGWAATPGERFRLRTPPAVRITVATLHPEEAPTVAATIADILSRRPQTRSS